MKIKRHNHMTSLRIPKEYSEWVENFAKRFDATPSLIYRMAIREFIQQRQRNAQS